MPAEDTVIDVDNTKSTFSKVSDVAWNFQRRQTFQVRTGTLAQLDVWVTKRDDPQGGCLRLSVSGPPDGEELFEGTVPADQVTAEGGYVSVYPGLTGLDPEATYSFEISNPHTTPDAGTYGIGYNDQGGNYLEGTEFYSVDAGGSWHGPEASGGCAP